MSFITRLDFVVLDNARNWTITEEVDGVNFELDVTPIYDHDGDSGMRLYVLEDIELKPFQKVVIPHGIGVRPPRGFETQIRPRSSTFMKKDSIVVLGTIDQPYGGEISSAVMYMPKPETIWVDAYEPCYRRGTEVLNDDGSKVWQQTRKAITVFPAESMWLSKGDRVSQLVLAAIAEADVLRIPKLTETSRGSGGWGSTDSVVRV